MWTRARSSTPPSSDGRPWSYAPSRSLMSPRRFASRGATTCRWRCEAAATRRPAGHCATAASCSTCAPSTRSTSTPDARTATVGGGCTTGAVDRACQAHGLATVTGRVSTTGIAGFTLGGGSGMLERRFGFAVDNLLGSRAGHRRWRTDHRRPRKRTQTCSGRFAEEAGTSASLPHSRFGCTRSSRSSPAG